MSHTHTTLDPLRVRVVIDVDPGWSPTGTGPVYALAALNLLDSRRDELGDSGLQLNGYLVDWGDPNEAWPDAGETMGVSFDVDAPEVDSEKLLSWLGRTLRDVDGPWRVLVVSYVRMCEHLAAQQFWPADGGELV